MFARRAPPRLSSLRGLLAAWRGSGRSDWRSCRRGCPSPRLSSGSSRRGRRSGRGSRGTGRPDRPAPPGRPWPRRGGRSSRPPAPRRAARRPPAPRDCRSGAGRCRHGASVGRSRDGSPRRSGAGPGAGRRARRPPGRRPPRRAARAGMPGRRWHRRSGRSARRARSRPPGRRSGSVPRVAHQTGCSPWHHQNAFSSGMKAAKLSEMAEWGCPACSSANPEGTRFCGHCGAKAPEAASAEERRLVTALFADISGFTPLAERLDPEELLEVIDPVVSALSSVVGRYDGFVEKFAGDALLALFGAPVSHDDDAARALRVALEMHQELARIVRDLPHDAELTLHVGVNSGHGIARVLGSEARMDYAVLGDSVILAQRLESAAPPGETYVSEMTVRLAEGRFEFEPLGKLTLKGKSEPIPAWRLVGRRQPGRSATRKGVATELVGRERELAILTDALDRLPYRAGAVVAVSGEPGVGKSR